MSSISHWFLSHPIWSAKSLEHQITKEAICAPVLVCGSAKNLEWSRTKEALVTPLLSYLLLIFFFTCLPISIEKQTCFFLLLRVNDLKTFKVFVYTYVKWLHIVLVQESQNTPFGESAFKVFVRWHFEKKFKVI